MYCVHVTGDDTSASTGVAPRAPRRRRTSDRAARAADRVIARHRVAHHVGQRQRPVLDVSARRQLIDTHARVLEDVCDLWCTTNTVSGERRSVTHNTRDRDFLRGSLVIASLTVRAACSASILSRRTASGRSATHQKQSIAADSERRKRLRWRVRRRRVRVCARRTASHANFVSSTLIGPVQRPGLGGAQPSRVNCERTANAHTGEAHRVFTWAHAR